MFCVFFVIIAELMRKPGENLHLEFEFAFLNIVITARCYPRLFYLDRAFEFRTHIFLLKIVATGLTN